LEFLRGVGKYLKNPTPSSPYQPKLRNVGRVQPQIAILVEL
jgi:hypothetical protein